MRDEEIRLFIFGCIQQLFINQEVKTLKVVVAITQFFSLTLSKAFSKDKKLNENEI